MPLNHPAYPTLKIMLRAVPEPNRTACFRILADNKERFEKAPGSTHNHQAWEGGYLDHITETMAIALDIREAFKRNWQRRRLPGVGDVILCLFLHDIEKPWKYIPRQDLGTKKDQQGFRRKLIERYGFELTEEQWNGVEYAEGEIHNYSNRKRNMSPLAAFVHMCDVWSARGWHDYGSKSPRLIRPPLSD